MFSFVIKVPSTNRVPDLEPEAVAPVVLIV